MSKMAVDHNAINLSQGYPDFPVPQTLLDMLNHYLNAGYNQYPPMAGVAYLRQQIVSKVELLYGVKVDSETEVTVTSGATEAIFVAIQAVIHAGDEVIVFDPAYDSYEPAVTLAQGETIHLPLDKNFNINWNAVKDAITPRTRMIVINSPHNPTGSIITAADLLQLASVIRNHDIHVVSDEVYEHMVFDDARHHSLLGIEELRQRTFVISSFGKTYHATGWKVAYCIAPAALTAEFRKVHQFVTFTTHTPTQWALAEFMEKCPEHYLNLANFYQRKRDLFLGLLSKSDFTVVPSEGTFFQLADYSALSNLDDVSFANHLTRNIGVAAIPVSVFYAHPPDAKIIRFCFAKDDETLKQACAKLASMGDL